MKVIAAIVAFVLTLTSFPTRAAEHVNIGSTTECEAAVKALFIDGAQDGWKREDYNGGSYFIKDNIVVFFSAYTEDRCTLSGEKLSEFRDRQSPSPKMVKVSDLTPINSTEKETWNCSEWCQFGFIILTAVVLGYFFKAAGGGGSQGCVYASDRAKNGSQCGGRASTVRAGGK